MNFTENETHTITEGSSFTFIIHGCDAAGFTALRNRARAHPSDFVIFGYSDDKPKHSEDIRGYYVLEVASTLHAFKTSLTESILDGGGSYSRISCEMDQVDPEIAITWCMQRPFTCQIGKRPIPWPNEIQNHFEEDTLPTRVSAQRESVAVEDKSRPSYSFQCSWCTDCDVDLNLDFNRK